MRLAPSIKRLFGWSPVRYASRVLVAQIGQSLRLQTVSLVSQALGILVVVFYFYRTLSHELVIGWPFLRFGVPCTFGGAFAVTAIGKGTCVGGFALGCLWLLFPGLCGALQARPF